MRLVCCDDHGMFLSALELALTSCGHEVWTTQDVTRVAELVALHRPDVCVIDMQFPGGLSGLTAADVLRAQEPGVKILLLTGSVPDSAWHAVEEGRADGIVFKSCDVRTLNNALATLVRGERVVLGWREESRTTASAVTRSSHGALTERERQVLALLVQGASTRTMAETLGVSVHTVRSHVQHVLQKLHVNGRGRATAMATEQAAHELHALALRTHEE